MYIESYHIQCLTYYAKTGLYEDIRYSKVGIFLRVVIGYVSASGQNDYKNLSVIGVSFSLLSRNFRIGLLNDNQSLIYLPLYPKGQ